METLKKQQHHPFGAQAYVVISVITMIRVNGGRTGTQEIQQKLMERGVYLTLRSIQRWLNSAASNGMPIVCDTHHPRGWMWKKDVTKEEAQMIETIKLLQEAA